MTLTEELYNALKLCPCRCGRAKDFSSDQWVEVKCGRCKAMQRFDEEFSARRHPELVQ